MNAKEAESAALRAGDLVPDHALTAEEPDRFGHEEIAERVADLVTTADTPLNIALFGSWGSGKSSFATLLKSALRTRKMKTEFVHYDAWKYQGEALQRSFIAEAATQLLGEDHDDYARFTSQLAQSVEELQLGLKEVGSKQRKAHFRWIRGYVVAPAALLVLAFIGLVVGASYAAGRSVGSELLRHAWAVGVAVLLTLLGVILKALIDTAKVKVLEGPPTEERLEIRFRDLLEAAKKHSHERFVFFIDELDRVAPDDIIATLRLIRAFIGQRNAVFVVAADKQVLERAFKDLPQATPVNEETPYYSSASEFVDKVFQHQIELPPLRGASLYRFAHDLVADQSGGVWEELRDAQPDWGLLDAVLYVLIPSHVRSPRRVKVLLNNFATKARIAQSRGIDWLQRAREIAKLTVLQTEFPLLAADLAAEPILLRFLLGTAGDVSISDRRRRVLERHGIAIPQPEEADSEAEEDEEEVGEALAAQAEVAEPTDTLLVPKEAQPRLISVQHENLMRYLRRVQDVRDPTGELLYLEPGGAAEGLKDPALGDLIETEARDDPGAVVDAIRDRDAEEQEAAIRVLAGMAEQEYGRERTNVISALLGAVRLRGGDLGSSLQPAADAVSEYVRTDPLETGQLIGALRLGIAVVTAGGDAGLRDYVLSDERLLAESSRVWTVATLLDDLPEEAQTRVMDAVARFLPETTDVLTEPLLVISPGMADRLLRHANVRAAAQELINDAETEEEAEKLARSWFDILEQRAEPAPLARLRLMRLLLDARSSDAYAVVREVAPVALEASGPSQVANGVALVALRQAEAADWDIWLSWLDESRDAHASHKQIAGDSLLSVFTELPQADEQELEIALDLVPLVAGVGRLEDDDVSAAFTSAIEGALQARAWWLSDDELALQEKLHEVVHALGLALGEEATEQFSGLRYQDLNRGLATAAVTPITCRAIRNMVVDFSAAEVNGLATRLASAPMPNVPESDVELVAARIHLSKEAGQLGEDADAAPYPIPIDQVVTAGRHNTAEAQEVVASWLATEPGSDDVSEFIAGLDRAPRGAEVDGFRAWLSRLPADDSRTQFLLRLVEQGGSALGWLRVVTSAPPRNYSEQVVAHAIADGVMRETRAEERKLASEAFASLAPQTAEGQSEVANLIIWLLERERKSDFEIALAIVPSLGGEHQMGQKVGRAFRRAADALGRKVPAKYKDTFEDARIVLGKDYFAQPKKSRISRLLGR